MVENSDICLNNEDTQDGRVPRTQNGSSAVPYKSPATMAGVRALNWHTARSGTLHE
jgi:hypothetical protein